MYIIDLRSYIKYILNYNYDDYTYCECIDTPSRSIVKLSFNIIHLKNKSRIYLIAIKGNLYWVVKKFDGKESFISADHHISFHQVMGFIEGKKVDIKARSSR